MTRVLGNPLRDLPEQFVDFTGNLVDAKPLLSGSERACLPKHHRPVLRHTSGSNGKHNVLTHFSKDPNGEICKRTKITRAPNRRRTKIDRPPAERLKRENRAIITSMQSLYKIWSPDGYKATNVKKKLRKKRCEAHRSSSIQKPAPR